jgi:hypothetical protein
MRNRNSIPPRWHLLPAEPSNSRSFRRWNTVVIVILGLLVLSVLLAAVGSTLESRGSAASKVSLPLTMVTQNCFSAASVGHPAGDSPARLA